MQASRPTLLRLLLSPLHLILALSIFFAFALLMIRFQYTGSLRFAFLVWNLFLAGIPLLAAASLKWLQVTDRLKWWSLVGLGGLWLLFLPNAPYILTDLIHFRKSTTNLAWLDLLVLLSFAWNGLIMGLISLIYVHDVVEVLTRRWMGWLFSFIAIGACSFGIYLGRFLRWNSWDIFTQPGELMSDIYVSIGNPVTGSMSWMITLAFSGFLMLAYVTIRLMIRQGKREQFLEVNR